MVLIRNEANAAISSVAQCSGVRPSENGCCWIEAKIGIVGCFVGPLLFLVRDDAVRRDALLKEFLPMAKQVREGGDQDLAVPSGRRRALAWR